MLHWAAEHSYIVGSEAGAAEIAADDQTRPPTSRVPEREERPWQPRPRRSPPSRSSPTRAIHPVRLAGAVEGVAARDRPGRGRLHVRRRRTPLARLQLAADGREHRPRRQAVTEAIARQAEKLPYISPFQAFEGRAVLGRRLAELWPGDIEKTFFTLGGAEANENAVKIAKMVTGRQKVLARYRSYHGSTYGTMMLTGDPRRWPNEQPPMPGVVHVLDPYHGPSEASTTRRPRSLCSRRRSSSRGRTRSRRSSSSRSPARTAS